MTEPRGKLAGLRILIVEDELLVAMDLQEFLEDLECEVVAMASEMEDAIRKVHQKGKLDGALLDLNLQSTSSESVADALKEQGIPFILVTGYAKDEGDSPVLKDAPRLNKPFNMEHLADLMVSTFLR